MPEICKAVCHLFKMNKIRIQISSGEWWTIATVPLDFYKNKRYNYFSIIAHVYP